MKKNEKSVIDTEYCYISDAVGIEFRPEMYRIKGKMIGKFKYRDPDGYSERLYIDLQNTWNRKGEKAMPHIKFQKHRSKLNLTDQYGRRYSSDYIGPSTSWAKYVLLEDIEIGMYLAKARTIGGHMLWPLNGTSRTINTARGGGNSLYDRIDLTLAELRCFFLEQPYIFKSCVRKAFEKEKDWFNLFGNTGVDGLQSFKQFIDYWNLNPFVCGDEYQVVSLAKSNIKKGEWNAVSSEEYIFPGNDKNYTFKEIMSLNICQNIEYSERLKSAYRNFVENSIWAIEQRNMQLATF